jgi:hypothetical protein
VFFSSPEEKAMVMDNNFFFWVIVGFMLSYILYTFLLFHNEPRKHYFSKFIYFILCFLEIISLIKFIFIAVDFTLIFYVVGCFLIFLVFYRLYFYSTLDKVSSNPEIDQIVIINPDDIKTFFIQFLFGQCCLGFAVGDKYYAFEHPNNLTERDRRILVKKPYSDKVRFAVNIQQGWIKDKLLKEFVETKTKYSVFRFNSFVLCHVVLGQTRLRKIIRLFGLC